ncbi:hypothetical protein L1987_29556 [Smallanthus sonchifolius]|uniref:Uncharacterized protein n=1 Tax=Smallanthus sonchifolius TaxID=185202 RepID=A0ACB9I1L7_9ASTR|nr:hypothetical protein L1987_29556 [Smallanthus sonchifolius]
MGDDTDGTPPEEHGEKGVAEVSPPGYLLSMTSEPSKTNPNSYIDPEEQDWKITDPRSPDKTQTKMNLKFAALEIIKRAQTKTDLKVGTEKMRCGCCRVPRMESMLLQKSTERIVWIFTTI